MSSASSPPPLPSPGRPSPVCDLHGDASAGSSEEGEDEDNLRRFMRTFGYKQDDFYDAGHGYESDSCFDGESSASDDIAYLRRLQEQFLAPAAALDIPGNPPILKPIRAFPPLDTDDEEDFETLRAIQRRFAHYGGETHEDFSPETNTTFSADSSEQDPHNIPLTIMMNEEHQEQSYIRFIESGDDANSLSVFPKFVKNFIDTPKSLLDNTPEPSDTCSRKRATDEEYPEENQSNFNQEYGLHSLSVRQFISSKFPKSVQNFVYALKKNRSCQRFIREKLIEIEAKIEVNRKLKERIKCLMEFHTAYKRKVGHRLCQKRDPRVRLISFQKQKSSTIKENSKKNSALYFAPAENAQMSNYKMVMRRFPVSLRKRQWSNTEKEKLLNGVNQQCLEMLFLNSMNLGSDFDGFNDSIIMSTFDCARHQVTPEILRSFIRLVNWDRLASMYLPRRSGPSCESRWLNHEDPMINCDPWTSMEDKKLLLIVQERGLYNWIAIASTLGTNRTPFQCLARYQRSLNPHILNREWTSEEDAKLCTAVETFGDKSWQIVASHLDGRTSNQCSVRWRNTLLPERKRVGRWSVDEDKCLKVAVILFGAKNWKKIAQFIPGRTQSQSRERWLNCLDPSLNLERWSEEEDGKILAAIAEHGHSWSKVAACIPGRTDNQCRRRWRVLLPHEVPMLKVAQQLKRTVLISNFVGREGERPAIGPNDFTPVLSFPAPDIANYAGVGKKRSRISQTKRFKFHKRERIEDIFASSELSEDALMALPLVHVMKLISRKSRAMHETLKKNINEEGMVTSGQVFPVDICTSETEPSTAVINIKRTLRISQTKRFKFHKRERIEDIFSLSELSEDALMALPLVHVMKLISRKSRVMHETSKKNINEEGGQVFPADICTSETKPSTTVTNIKRTLSKDAKAMCSKKSRISKANYANESNLSDDMNGIGNISNIENNMEHLVSVFPVHDQLVDNLTLPEREQTVVNNTECTATATKGMPSKGVCFDPGSGKDEHLQTAIGAGLDTTSSQVEMNRNHDTVD